MIFSELYGAYYNAVAGILREAAAKPLKKDDIRALIEKYAFGESVLSIEPALTEERWQLIRADGSTPLRHAPDMPLTTLEKRWLKAISADPRIRLFTDDIPDLPDTEPLFRPEDICVFDRYADGDPYDDASYIARFRLILDAVKKHYPLTIDVTNRKGNIAHMNLMPEYIEYSEKDDKFRLISSGCRYGSILNIARIVKCEPYLGQHPFHRVTAPHAVIRTVEFELTDERNALERALMHFAHFEKQAERLGDGRYRITVNYDIDDETEMVIRILSFGPRIRVTSPQYFIELIKERLLSQKSCER